MHEAIILAGGFGTRLKTVLNDLPKPMAPIQEKPFLEFLLQNLNQNGFDRVVISVGYLKEKIIDYFGTEYNGMKIVYAEEDTPLGTGGAILNSIKHLSDTGSVCMALNGDSFLDLSYPDALNLHNKSKSFCTIISNYMQDASRYGLLDVTQNRVNSFVEKQPLSSGYINSGIYLFTPKLLSKELIKFSLPFSFEKFLESNINKLKVNAFKTEGYFIDIGIPKDYSKAQKDFPTLFSL